MYVMIRNWCMIFFLLWMYCSQEKKSPFFNRTLAVNFLRLLWDNQILGGGGSVVSVLLWAFKSDVFVIKVKCVCKNKFAISRIYHCLKFHHQIVLLQIIIYFPTTCLITELTKKNNTCVQTYYRLTIILELKFALNWIKHIC